MNRLPRIAATLACGLSGTLLTIGTAWNPASFVW